LINSKTIPGVKHCLTKRCFLNRQWWSEETVTYRSKWGGFTGGIIEHLWSYRSCR